MRNFTYIIIIVSALVLCSCFFPPSRQESKEVMSERAKTDSIRNLYKPVSVTLRQLIGVWEITEVRNNPNGPGKKANADQSAMLFEFTEDGKISTMSKEMQYTSDMLSMKTPIKIINGRIYTTEKNRKFDLQFDQYLEVLMIKESEMALRCSKDGIADAPLQKDEFWYLKKWSN